MIDFFFRFNVIGDVIQKVQRHHDLIKAHAIDNVYQTLCNAAVNINGNG